MRFIILTLLVGRVCSDPTTILSAIYADLKNVCTLSHALDDISKQCPGDDFRVSRNIDENCEYDECGTPPIEQASVGDSYRGQGNCWDAPGWIGTDNAQNRLNIKEGYEPTNYPRCWWFGPEHVVNYTEFEASADQTDCLSEYSTEDEQFACFCRHEHWENGQISNSDGVTMIDACCACGGGTSWDPADGPPTPAPTYEPSVKPTSAPTAFILPAGATTYLLVFPDVFFEPEIYLSAEFATIVKVAVSGALNTSSTQVVIFDVRAVLHAAASGEHAEDSGVVVEFFIDGAPAYSPAEKFDDILSRILESTHTGSTSYEYAGISTASFAPGPDRDVPEAEDTTPASVGAGFGVAAGMLLIVFAGSLWIKKYKKARSASAFTYHAPQRWRFV